MGQEQAKQEDPVRVANELKATKMAFALDKKKGNEVITILWKVASNDELDDVVLKRLKVAVWYSIIHKLNRNIKQKNINKGAIEIKSAKLVVKYWRPNTRDVLDKFWDIIENPKW